MHLLSPGLPDWLACCIHELTTVSLLLLLCTLAHRCKISEFALGTVSSKKYAPCIFFLSNQVHGLNKQALSVCLPGAAVGSKL